MQHQIVLSYVTSGLETYRTFPHAWALPIGNCVAQVAPSLAINYCAYETLRSYWLSFQPERTAPTISMSLVAGSFAGLVSSTATFPLDLARRRLQLEGQARRSHLCSILHGQNLPQAQLANASAWRSRELHQVQGAPEHTAEIPC